VILLVFGVRMQQTDDPDRMCLNKSTFLQAFPRWPTLWRQVITKALIGCFVLVFAALSCLASSAVDDYLFEREPKRIAIVIGNESYTNLQSIPSARNDAEQIAERLRGLCFDVEDCYMNVRTLQQFEYEILPKFGQKINEGDFVVFYFSGHGFSHGPHSFLAPVEIPLSIEEKDVTRQAISVEAFEDYIAGRLPGLILFLIDACRTIPGFIVRSASGQNVVGKSYSLPTRYDSGVNTMIAYATRPGYISWGSAEPGHLSVFTRALVDHIGAEGKVFGTCFDDVAADVKVWTDSQQAPGLYDWSETDPYLRPNTQNLSDLKEYWTSVLETGNYQRIKVFSLRYSVSRQAAAVRKWLNDHREETRASNFTLASPEAIDRAWRPGGGSRVGIRRLSLPLAFNRSIEESQQKALREFSDAEIGLVPSGMTRERIAALRTGQKYVAENLAPELKNRPLYPDSLAFSLACIDAHGSVVAIDDFLGRTMPLRSAEVVQRVPFGTQLNLEGVTIKGDNTLWLKASISNQPDPLYIPIEPGTTPLPLELGHSVREVVLPPRANSIPELVDPAPLVQALRELKGQGWKITWVSLATAPAEEEREEQGRAARVANAERILKAFGIDGRRITSVAGRTDVAGDGVRVRLFGTLTEQ